MVKLRDTGKYLLTCFCTLTLFAPIVTAGAAQAKTETVLYSFQNNGADGNVPAGNLINVHGTLYGTTEYGGTSNVGTVYSIDPTTHAEVVLYSFQNNGADGYGPVAELIDFHGTLYGTTLRGGASGGGTVYSINPFTGAENVVYSFENNGEDGIGPYAGLTNVKGTLYGTTIFGGHETVGIVFSVNPVTGAESVLHAFSTDGGDGQNPQAGLTDIDGTLYGTTSLGGDFGNGTVFSIDPSTGAYSVLYSFGNGGDGNAPESNVLNVHGTLYGTTGFGGASGVGTVYSINPSTGKESVLYSFQDNGADGKIPVGNVIDVHGTLYGATERGGASAVGTVYSLDPSTGAEKVVYSFQNNGGDGTLPIVGLIDFRNALYGTTTGGGAQNEGTVFKIKP